jgi:hypothetical protein
MPSSPFTSTNQPEANPSAYISTSTGIGTPMALLSVPLWMAAANYLVG